MKKLILAAALLSPMPLAAQSVSANQPASVGSAMQAMGLDGQIGTTSDGSPAIVSQLNGATFSILFVSCDDPRGCQDLQLRAVFATPEAVALDTLNAWNQSTFMGKAFQIGETVVLEHPIAGVDGLSRYSFTRTMARWELALNDFRQRLASPE